MTATRVSVVIPTCGRGHFLRGAIQSVLSQSFEAWEVIVVDDSRAGDGMAPVVDEFHDERIRYCRNERTAGANGARNTGIRKARGEYIAMLDDDDLFLPGKLEKQVQVLDENPDIGVVTTQACVITEDGQEVRRIANDLTPEEIRYNLIFANCIVHSSTLIRKEWLLLVGGYDEKLDQAQDYDLWSRLVVLTKFFQINEILVCWREHPESITGRSRWMQDMDAIFQANENVNRICRISVSMTKIAKLREQKDDTLSELKKTIEIFQEVFRYLVREQKGNTMYCRKMLLLAKNQKMEKALYFYFSSRPRIQLLLGFIVVPLAAKKLLCLKAATRLTRIIKK